MEDRTLKGTLEIGSVDETVVVGVERVEGAHLPSGEMGEDHERSPWISGEIRGDHWRSALTREAPWSICLLRERVAARNSV